VIPDALQTHGSVAPGFEPVMEAFASGAGDLGEGGGAYAVTLDGRPVVDLWAGQADEGKPWTRDTAAVLMSTTKGLTALCAQVLSSRGLLDVEAPVSAYWPEFGSAGKEKATVRQVLDHTVGVLGFADPGSLLDWDGTGWDDLDAIADRIAATEPAWEPGTRIGYHAISCGWLTNEIVRRITGRTVGEVLRTEVAEPLGLQARIGTPRPEQDRVARVIPESYDGIPPEMVEVDRMIRGWFDEPGTLLSTAAIHMHGGNIISRLGTFMNDATVRALEIPAANGTASARDLARTYGVLARGGEIDGVRIVSEESVRLFSTVSAEGRSAVTPEVTLPSGMVIPAPFTCYALGYARNLPEPGMPPPFGPNVETFGHAGHGGQVGFADPVAGLGVGFVRSHLSLTADFAAGLIATTYSCLS
jgi:CubicO group peptidase (beta-lactamase class C family)